MIALPLALALALGGLELPARSRPPAPAAAEAEALPDELTDAELEERIQTYLGAIDVPVPADRWRALGPRAVPFLAGIARSSQALPSRRARALRALSLLGGTTARQTVLEVARSEEAPFTVRASAIEGAGRLLPAKELSRTIRPIMEGARRATVRAVAAETLARRAPRSACSAVRAQAAREGPRHRASFGRALGRCEQAAP
jgi:hypothetical protein